MNILGGTMDTLPPEDIEHETLWHLYVDLLQDYEVLQEEKSRLWDIIQRNMQSYSERLYALEHAEQPDFTQSILAEQTNLHAALETIKQLSERVNEESGKFPLSLSSESAPVQRALVAERGRSQEKFSPVLK